tara:strand:+ start:2065 stop:2232 length:168 start_codon:yes stop_codon:yes gene_type:complete
MKMVFCCPSLKLMDDLWQAIRQERPMKQNASSSTGQIFIWTPLSDCKLSLLSRGG